MNWERAEAIVKAYGLQELYRRDPMAWGAYVLDQDQRKQREAERAAWHKRQEKQREQRAWAKILPNYFEIWHDGGQLLWKGSMREQLFAPVRQAFEVLTQRGANLERLLGKNVLRISDVPQSGLSNPDAQAECDQIRNHIRCGPGSNFETILHEIGHAVEYNLRPETVMRRHRKSLSKAVSVGMSSVEKAPPADDRFKELDEEFERVQRGEMKPISQYGATSLTEWFAESFMYYWAHPMHLREKGPGSYGVLKRLTT
jgi:hypothetical protein